MAVRYEGIDCALCKAVINRHESSFATSDVFFSEEHALFSYSDALMHWDCYGGWEHCAEFAHAYMNIWIEAERDNPYWGRALLSTEMLVKVNPSSDVSQISVLLAETGSDIRGLLGEWEDWLEIGWRTAGQHPVEQRAVDAVIPHLRVAVPTGQSVIEAVDWEAKWDLVERHRERAKVSEDARLHKPTAHNKVCRALLREGVNCPVCGTNDPLYIDRSPEEKSSFMCRSCDSVFGPVEVSVKRLYG